MVAPMAKTKHGDTTQPNAASTHLLPTWRTVSCSQTIAWGCIVRSERDMRGDSYPRSNTGDKCCPDNAPPYPQRS